MQGDVSLLGALAAEVLLPGLRVGVPEDPAAAEAAAAAVPATATKDASPVGKCPGGRAGAAALKHLCLLWRQSHILHVAGLTSPPLPLLMCDAAAGAAPASGAAKPSAGGKLERPDELLPELLRQVQAAPRLSKQKVGACLP